MKGAQVLVQKGTYCSAFLTKLYKALKRSFQSLPPDEIQARKVWAEKMLERIQGGDIEALYRRSWLHEALLLDYFAIRKKRYPGTKESFAWLREKDPAVYRLFHRVLSHPTDHALLKKLVAGVTRKKRD